MAALMEPLLAIAVSLIVLYGCVCGLVVDDDEAPRWLRWPGPAWKLIAHSWRLPQPVPQRPDYARIARLERELGIGDPEPEPERPMRRGPQVCLTKNCLGGTSDIRTWSGVLVRRIHECG